MAELASKINSLPHAKAAEELAKWRESISADQGPGAKDLLDIADRLSKEFNVQASDKTPIRWRRLLEQQLRLRMDEIPVGTEWLSFSTSSPIRKEPRNLATLPPPSRFFASIYSKLEQLCFRTTRPHSMQHQSALASELEKLGKQSWFYPAPSAIGYRTPLQSLQPFLWTAVLSGIALIIPLSAWDEIIGPLPRRCGDTTRGRLDHDLRHGDANSDLGRPPVTNMYETIIWASFVMTALANRPRDGLSQTNHFSDGCTYAHPRYAAGIRHASRVRFLHRSARPVPSRQFLAHHSRPHDRRELRCAHARVDARQRRLTYYLFGNDRPDNVKTDRSLYLPLYSSRRASTCCGNDSRRMVGSLFVGTILGMGPQGSLALIALLGYLAVLHARFAGLIKTFGLIVWSGRFILRRPDELVRREFRPW